MKNGIRRSAAWPRSCCRFVFIWVVCGGQSPAWQARPGNSSVTRGDELPLSRPEWQSWQTSGSSSVSLSTAARPILSDLTAPLFTPFRCLTRNVHDAQQETREPANIPRAYARAARRAWTRHPPPSLCDPPCRCPNSRSLSTVREFFNAKLRSLAKDYANKHPSDCFWKTCCATSRKAAQKLVRQLEIRCSIRLSYGRFSHGR